MACHNCSPKFKFAGRVGESLTWESRTRLPGDSRIEVVSANAEWFYGTMIRGSVVPPEQKENTS